MVTMPGFSATIQRTANEMTYAMEGAFLTNEVFDRLGHTLRRAQGIMYARRIQHWHRRDARRRGRQGKHPNW